MSKDFTASFSIALEEIENGLQSSDITKENGDFEIVSLSLKDGAFTVAAKHGPWFDHVGSAQLELTFNGDDNAHTFNLANTTKTISNFYLEDATLASSLISAVDEDGTVDAYIEAGVTISYAPHFYDEADGFTQLSGKLEGRKWSAVNSKIGELVTKFVTFDFDTNELEVIIKDNALGKYNKNNRIKLDLVTTVIRAQAFESETFKMSGTHTPQKMYKFTVTSAEFGKFLEYQLHQKGRPGFKAETTVVKGFVPPNPIGEFRLLLEPAQEVDADRASYNAPAKGKQKGQLTSSTECDKIRMVQAFKDYGVVFVLKDFDEHRQRGKMTISIQQSAEMVLDIVPVSGGMGVELKVPELADLMLDSATKRYPVGLDLQVSVEDIPAPVVFDPEAIPECCHDSNPTAEHFKLRLWNYISKMYPTISQTNKSMDENHKYLVETINLLLQVPSEDFEACYSGFRTLVNEYKDTVFAEDYVLQRIDALGDGLYPKIQVVIAIFNIVRVDLESPTKTLFNARIDLGKLEEYFYFNDKQAENVRYYYDSH